MNGSASWRASLALAALAAVSARADNRIVVDIDATTHTVANPVTVFLEAGRYSVVPIGVADGGLYDAWDPWDDADCTEPAGCAQTDPTSVIGWKNAYDVISDALTDVHVSGSPLSPVDPEPVGPDGIQDYWLASASETDRYHVDDGLVYPTATDALTAAEPSEFTVSESGLVGFSIRDGNPGDNAGGMSLAITPLPEPASAPALALGFAGLALRVPASRRQPVRAPRPRRTGAGCRAAARRSADPRPPRRAGTARCA